MLVSPVTRSCIYAFLRGFSLQWRPLVAKTDGKLLTRYANPSAKLGEKDEGVRVPMRSSVGSKEQPRKKKRAKRNWRDRLSLQRRSLRSSADALEKRVFLDIRGARRTNYVIDRLSNRVQDELSEWIPPLSAFSASLLHIPSNSRHQLRFPLPNRNVATIGKACGMIKRLARHN